jgi:hypothetical protein
VPDKMRPYYCARTAFGAGETLQKKGGVEPAMPEGLVREFRVMPAKQADASKACVGRSWSLIE